MDEKDTTQNVFQLVSLFCDGCDRECSECSGQDGHCNCCNSMNLRLEHTKYELWCDDCGWYCDLPQ